MEITVTLTDNSLEVLDALQNSISRSGYSVGESVERWAKENITEQGAVETGNLRNSVTYQVKESGDGVTTTVGTDVDYAPYIEFGTGKYSSYGGGTWKDSWIYQDEFGAFHKAFPQKPRPFLEPAATDHADEIQQIVIESLKNA